MYIVSKFKDYYDVGVSYGIDKKLYFGRSTSKIDKKISMSKPITIEYKEKDRQYQIVFNFMMICFCKRAYPLIEVMIKEEGFDGFKVIHSNIFYTIESLLQFVEKYYPSFFDSDDCILDGYYHINRLLYLESFFKEGLSEREEEIFYLYKVPYYLLQYAEDGEGCILLPQLKQYKFIKAVPPMQAFQEISMFLGTLNIKEDNTLQIDDKYLAQGKGFDCYSFKKMPSKRKVKHC
jgi:hypothetical protein